MDFATIILIVAGVISLLIFVNTFYSLSVAQKDIFRGSGAPVSMAQVLLSSVHLVTQHYIAILLIVTIALLIASGTVKSEAGLPILSAIAGYSLGKSFKDTGTISSN